MDAGQLGRWTRFAAKGGIGKCTALQDCVAERAEDLMFMQDDEITVLMQVPGQVDLYLGYCEGVVGHFRGEAVRFHGRLKKPVLTKRLSTASPISRPSSSQSALTVFARDAASPAVSVVRDPPSPIMPSVRDLPSPTISVTREPDVSPPPIAPSLSSSSTISIAAFSHAPSPQPAQSSGHGSSSHPERSMSHESQATSFSSMPETPADYSHDEASIASDPDDDQLGPAPLAPPLRIDQLAKQLSTDSPIEHPHLPDPTTSRFPPVDRDSSIYSDDQSSHRISIATSDNGAGNIGLSLLQDFVGGMGDSDSDDDDDPPSIPIPRVQSPESDIDEALDYADSMRSDSQYSESPRSTTQVLPNTNTLEPPLTGRSEFSEPSASQYSQSPPVSATHPPPAAPLSPASPASPRLFAMARSESEYESDGEGDWEGADDIYDQYRYSRFSMASKMSRFSKGSIYTVGSGSDAPPMPNQRTSVDSTGSGRERKESKGKLPSRLVESTIPAEVDDGKEPSRMEKNRPAPLTLSKEPQPSPLLHTTFGSPQASPSLPSATSGTFGSPTLVSPLYPSNAAAATNAKRRADAGEDESTDSRESHPHSEEREGMPMTAKSQAGEIVDDHLSARQSPPPTPAIPAHASQAAESSAAKEKRMLALSNADETEGPPPPPYSPTASDASSPLSMPTPGPSTSQMPVPVSVPVPATSPPPQPVVIPPPGHPQARIRDPNRPAPHPLMRQSLFMPHPGAPKPAPSTAGPMYGRPQPAQQHLPPPQHMGPPLGSIHHFLGMAFAARREGRSAPPTVYGRLEYDLSTSFGPVPITFSHEPQNNIPANRAARPPMPWTPSRTGSPASQLAIDLAGRRSADPTRRSATSPPAPPPPQMLNAPGSSPPSQLAIDLAGRRSADPTGRRSAASPPIPPPAHIEQMLSAAGPPLGPAPGLGGGPALIQRTNFTPTVHKSRPRSRSFSALTSGMDLSIKVQALNEGSRDDSDAISGSPLSPPLSPIRPLQITTKRSKSAMATTTTIANVPAPQRATVSHSPTVLRGLHAPSPLSQSQTNTVPGGRSAVVAPPVRSPPLRASTNPLPASSPPADLVTAAQQQISRSISLDERPSLESNGTASPRLAVNGIGQGSPEPQLQSPLATLPEAVILSTSPPSSPRSVINFPPPGSPRVLRHSRSAMLPTSTRTSFSNHMSSPPRTRIASQGLSNPRLSVDTVRSEASSPSGVSRMEEASDGGGVIGLHINKRSNGAGGGGRPQMTPLRLVPSDQGSHQSIKSPTVSVSTTSEFTTEQDTVQVQDTDFELIKPSLPMSPLGGSFESLPSPSPVSTRPGFLRTDSPALSELSGHSLGAGQGFAQPGSASPSDTRPVKESDASQIEAHRQRELRWISTLSTISPSQARKSKKIRKMVLDGVPASVRYQVWAALTDSKGKRMEGLYQRLAQREKVAAYAQIERDVQTSFAAHPQLRDGSLAKLLQAYLCMVPDIQYTRGLSLIAAQLLLQSPEEDAFWTFISLMDSHLRPYFSKSSVQLEVDATLFAKALESNDAASAKKLFGSMAISPVVVCRAWFTTVFADALPPDYLVRLWDVFLFEGVTFLFRAGLALFACTRRVILQSPSPEAVLQALAHPPLTCLPPHPDAFIELAFSMKFKDDDVRKQRSKLEAQVKRRTAQARAAPMTPTIASTISLPKNGS